MNTITPATLPTNAEIRELATNEQIPLYAEAYEIAVQYNRISQALSERLLGRSDLNWCGFAQWSSKAVGASLRLDNNSGFLKKLGRLHHIPMIVEPLFRLVTLALLGGSYGVGLSTANRTIFAEMASFHIAILSEEDEPTMLQVTSSDPNRCLLKDLGQPGRDLLCTAYRLLNEAKSASGLLRSELILGANIALSAYEQDRVQPALDYVFYRPVRWLLQVSWRIPYYYLSHRSTDRFIIYRRRHQDQPPFMRNIEDRWVRMYSKTLWLKTAVNTIMLSKPMIFFPRGSNPSLLRPAATFECEEVENLVRKYGPQIPANSPGVANWLGYEERMRFIVAYFMGYQQVEQMFGKPRFKRNWSWRKPRMGEPLSMLEFRKVTL
jgi:hypothetical protein